MVWKDFFWRVTNARNPSHTWRKIKGCLESIINSTWVPCLSQHVFIVMGSCHQEKNKAHAYVKAVHSASIILRSQPLMPNSQLWSYVIRAVSCELWPIPIIKHGNSYYFFDNFILQLYLILESPVDNVEKLN